MLSAETATGDYPLDAVRAMDRIIREMERHALAKDDRRLAPRGDAAVPVEDSIAIGTSAVARMLKTPLIVTLTKGGFTSRKVAARRPSRARARGAPDDRAERRPRVAGGLPPGAGGR